MEYFLFLISALSSRIVAVFGLFRGIPGRRILVVKLDHIGDVVTATPAFRELGTRFPGVPIDAVVGPWGAEVLRGNPHIDRIWVYESARFRRKRGKAGDRATDAGLRPRPLSLMREIAAQRYSHIVELRGDAWTLLLPFLTGARARADRGTIRLRRWLSRRLGGRPNATHEVETNLAIARSLHGAPERSGDARHADSTRASDVEGARVEMFLDDRDREVVRSTLRSLGIADHETVIALHPGASWRPRAWYPERFAEVAARLLDATAGHVVFLGGPEDRDIAERIGALLPSPRAHFLFEQPLAHAAALIERSSLLIANDGGLAHVAAAVGTPLVALFGAQDPRRFRPWSTSAVVLHKPVHCFPCAQVTCVHPELPCVNLISVDEVLHAAEPLLARSSGDDAGGAARTVRAGT